MKRRKTYQNLVQSILLNALLVLMICFTQKVNAQNSLLQNKISIDITELSINDALDSIAAKNNCYFTYNSDLFTNKKKLSIKADEVEFEILLRKIVQDTSLTFQVVNKHINFFHFFFIGGLLFYFCLFFSRANGYLSGRRLSFKPLLNNYGRFDQKGDHKNAKSKNA